MLIWDKFRIEVNADNSMHSVRLLKLRISVWGTIYNPGDEESESATKFQKKYFFGKKSIFSPFLVKIALFPKASY